MSHKSKSEQQGEIYAFLAMFLGSLFPVVLKMGVGSIQPLQLLAYSNLIAAVPFTILLFFPQKKPLWHPKILPYLLVILAFNLVLSYGLIFLMTPYTSSINLTLLLQSELIFATLVGFLLGDKIDFSRVFGSALILLGNFFILMRGPLTLHWPDLVIFLVPILFVIGNNVTKHALTMVSWKTILFTRTFFGGFIVLFLAHLFEGLVMPAQKDFLLLFVLGIVLFGVSKIFWQFGLERLDVSKATAVIMMSPAFSLLFSILILKEIPDLSQMFGIVAMAFGFSFILRSVSSQSVKQMH